MSQDIFSDIYQTNSGYVDEIFQRYQENPKSVGLEWQAFFSGFQVGFSTASSLSTQSDHYLHLLDALSQQKKIIGQNQNTQGNILSGAQIEFELRCAQLVVDWRAFGHLNAKVNPFSVVQKDAHYHPEFVKGRFTSLELAQKTKAGMIANMPEMTLNELIEALGKKYSGTVSAEFSHIEKQEEREWLYQEYESIFLPVDKDTQLKIYQELAKTDALEKTIATKYVGKKRFSIEGADAQITACNSFMDECAKLGAQECTVAIAHRGRLNFLVNVIGKPLELLLAEWEGKPHDGLLGDTDVKYHFGYESIQTTRNGYKMSVSMPFNPSHLEYVDSVVMGETRARQQLYYSGETSKVVSIVFHGDAAVAGQGIVFEVAQMMNLEGYRVGGTVHVVANNQVGFTTDPVDSRSSTYCTDVAKVTGSPVIHIHCDEIDLLHNVMTLCARYRAKFKKDIYIDLVCFRRYGHNEADEPTFTQPLMYKKIKEMPSPYESYGNYLSSTGKFQLEELKSIHKDYRSEMNKVYDKVVQEKIKIKQFHPLRLAGELSRGTLDDMLQPINTKISIEILKDLAHKITLIEQDFHVNTKLARIIVQARQAMAKGQEPVDWGMAELLAYASLASEGYSIRLAGEDVQRGTFSHRHATLVDAENGSKYTALETINPNVKIEFINSLLSEEGALGFEYGYTITHPNCLTLWEGQFGDFVNGAQVIIDQFLAAGETKWAQQQGLVLLLPHGLEGMGPEHSSARPERFLQLCAEGNMQVCCLTSGSQLFHVLRRQLHRSYRKPLVIMTPKSFLRSPWACSSLDDLAQGCFKELLDDARIDDATKVEKVLFCSGKIAFDLLDALEQETYKAYAEKIAIVRIEQLYPLAHEQVLSVVSRYSNAKLFWVQEEPKNMGYWTYIFEELITHHAFENLKLHYIGRSKRPSPAVGLDKAHQTEQEKIIHHALASLNSYEV